MWRTNISPSGRRSRGACRHRQVVESIPRTWLHCCFPACFFIDIFKIFVFAIFSEVFPFEARRAQTVVAVHDELGPQMAMLEVAAGPEVHVEVRAVNVVGCFNVAQYERL
jgi:hypothetical protein